MIQYGCKLRKMLFINMCHSLPVRTATKCDPNIIAFRVKQQYNIVYGSQLFKIIILKVIYYNEYL